MLFFDIFLDKIDIYFESFSAVISMSCPKVLETFVGNLLEVHFRSLSHLFHIILGYLMSWKIILLF